MNKRATLFTYVFFFLGIVIYSQTKIKKTKKMETTITTTKMKIEVWSDIMCPFCYIGKRKFEQAFNQYSNRNNIELIWKSYQLDPSSAYLKDQKYATYLSKRKGWSPQQVADILANVTNMAKEVGLEYHFEKAIVANSLNGHRLSHLAAKHKLQDKAEEALFKAHFVEGKDISDKTTLVEIGKSIGLDSLETEKVLASSDYLEEVKQDIKEAEEIGVTGVPFFVFNRKYAISGAQDSKAFLQTIEKAYSEWEKENKSKKLEVINGQSCSVDGKCD